MQDPQILAEDNSPTDTADRDPKKSRGLFSGCFAGRDFEGQRIKMPNEADRLMDGNFTGATFRRAEIIGAKLAGDFSHADFTGARFLFCELSGKFDGASGIGSAIGSSIVSPSASFRQADLKGGGLTRVSPCQVAGAQVCLRDRISVATEDSIIVNSVRYELVVPIQCIPDVTIVDAGQDLPHRTGCLLTSWLESPRSVGKSEPFLFDVVRLSKALIREAPLRSQTGSCQGNEEYCLNAPGVTLQNFKRSHGIMALAGNFEGAAMEDTEMPILSLAAGCFNGLDLTRSIIRDLNLEINEVEVAGLELPQKLERVRFGWYANKRRNELLAGPGYAPLVIDAWHCESACDALARYILKHAQQSSSVRGKLLDSKALTVKGVARVCRPLFRDFSVAVGLVARRNQLRHGSHRHPRRSAPISAAGGSNASVQQQCSCAVPNSAN